MYILSLFLWLSVLTLSTFGEDISIVKWVKNSNKYQQWLKVIERDESKSKSFLMNNLLDITTFIPDDEAFRKSKYPPTDVVGAHIVQGVYDAESLIKLQSTGTIDQQRPKLRFTRGFDKLTNKSSVYVFDAKILESHKVGGSMVHIIDRVLNAPKATSSVAPNALDLINYPQTYPISVDSGVTLFSNFINETKSSHFFECSACTYFVPETMASDVRKLLDRPEFAAAHVIPNVVLFFRTMDNDTRYLTKADNEKLHVELFKVISTQRSDGFQTPYIYASSKGSLKGHRIGNTGVKVTQADIPVSNGVVHFIQKPLLITDMTVTDYIEREGQADLYHFLNLLNKYPNLKGHWRHSDVSRPLTMFAFTNDAYKSVENDINILSQNSTAMEELMKLHMVEREIVTSANASVIKERSSVSSNKKLYFSVAGDRLYVEGDGVKAATILQDLACTNGVIHVINKVLGIPSSPIKDKLREDPQLRTTYTVAEKMRSDWINRLGNRSKNFTFFAPSEAAWKKLLDEDPSSHKQLVDGLYTENAMTILNRHLVLNQAISLENLMSMETVDTVNSQLQIETKAQPDGPKVTIKFMQLRSAIVRPDIKAINGYIHEIDTVLMNEADLAVDASLVRGSASIAQTRPIVLTLIAAIILRLF